MTIFNKYINLLKRDHGKSDLAADSASRVDNCNLNETDVDLMSKRQREADPYSKSSMHDAPLSKAYYIGPWGDNMSVFAARTVQVNQNTE